MPSLTGEILDFVLQIKFEDLPRDVRHETKRFIIDSIGAAMVGLRTEKGRYALEVATSLGGPSESSILGTGQRVSCGNAAFANGETINATDYDAFTYPAHATPVIPASLALGETVGASGKDVILSTALGLELTRRLATAIRGSKKVFSTAEGIEVGKLPGTKNPVSVVGTAVLGGATGVGRILKLNREEMANAMGLAAHFTPFPQAKWQVNPPKMTKYLSHGWAAMAMITATLLANMGYTGDATVLDGDLGYWRFFGGAKWEPGTLTDSLGQEWKMLGGIEYRRYPTCTQPVVMLDLLYKVMDENKLAAKDIEKIRVQGTPAFARALFTNRSIASHIDAQFSVPYIAAVASNRLSPTEWQDAATMKDPEILKFMDKVSVEVHPGYNDLLAKEPRSNLTAIEITANGRTLREEAKYPGLASSHQESEKKGPNITEKFVANAASVLNRDRVDRAIHSLKNLESVADINQVTGLLTL